jgi:UDP-N-acetylglucosamine 4-epimerase
MPPQIANIEIIHGPERKGDIPHSLASVEKAKTILGYVPSHNLEKGLSAAAEKLWNGIGKI